MAGSFDPMALDKPTLALGEHGSWTLGDITQGREKALQSALAAIEAALETAESDDADVDGFVKAVGELAEAACENGGGVIAAKVVELYESEQIGAKGLRGLVEFIQEWLVDGLTLGEELSPN
jgi:hypothetical protein